MPVKVPHFVSRAARHENGGSETLKENRPGEIMQSRLPRIEQVIRCAIFALLLAPFTSFSANHNVAIIDNEFVPRNLTIAPGDTVIWTNQGSDHTVTADDGSFDSTAGGQAAIPTGGMFTKTFSTAGKFPYYCTLHGGPGGQDMSGVIRVAEPGSNHVPQTPTNVAPAAGAVGQSPSPTLSATPFSDEDTDDIHLSSQWLLRDVVADATVLDTGEDFTNKTSLPLSGLENNKTYGWRVRYRDDLGGWSSYSVETQFTTVALSPSDGTGLTASYGKYNRRLDTNTIVVTTSDPTINFDWNAGKPKRGLPADNFFVRWEGTVLPEFSERYRFRVRADGGVRLWVNGVSLIDDWVVTPFAIYRNNVIELQAGIAVPVKLDYFDTFGNASVQLRWSSPSRTLEVVPQQRLFPVTP
jgi:plastocyanin